METRSRVALLLGRLGVGLIFLVSGIGKVTGWSGTVAYAARKGVPVSLLAIYGAWPGALGIDGRYGQPIRETKGERP